MRKYEAALEKKRATLSSKLSKRTDLIPLMAFRRLCGLLLTGIHSFSSPANLTLIS